MDVDKDIAACMDWLNAHHADLAAVESPILLNKSGLVPYHTETGEVLLMKPVAKHKDLNPPGWQIAKGTRMMQHGNHWHDMKKPSADFDAEKAEPLACTALREGIEEAGLKLQNVKSLKDCGTQTFYSASSGNQKQMAVFLCYVKNKNDFHGAHKIAATTAETAWFPLNSLPSDVRQDNIAILELIRKTLA